MKPTAIRFDDLQAVELTTKALRLVAIHDFGPRLAFFGKPDGENLLFWAPHAHGRKEWKLHGGHRVWATRPGADECEETYRPDNEPCEVETFRDGFALIGALDPSNGVRRGVRVRRLSDDRLEVDNFVQNAGEMLYSAGVWALTCTAPRAGTVYAAPLGDGSAWDYSAIITFGQWAGHVGGFDDPQFSLKRDLFVVRPHGKENKRMLLCPRGIMAMSDPARGVTFAKKMDYVRGASYPLGANLAFYVGPGNFMVEMETMGAEITLRPGEVAHNVETWALAPQALALDGAAGLLQMF
jgi:hypothetical protein